MRLLTITRGEPGDAIRELLNTNVIGTPGKSLVYQHLRVDDKLDHIQEPIFLSVVIGGKPVGTCCLVKRLTWSGGESINSYYIRYFSFKSSFRSSTNILERPAKQSALKWEIQQVLDGNFLSPSGPHVFYAYVDPSNIRSGRIVHSFGFKELGRFRTVFYSRFNPKLYEGIKIIEKSELILFKQRLKESYIQSSLFTHENIGFEDGCLAYYHQGRIVAALQANPEHWSIFEIPGSKYLIHLISWVPFLNRLLNKEFRFLSVEGVFLEEGFEHLLSPLLEGALKIKNRNTAILCLDPGSDLYGRMQNLNRGFISRLTSEKEMAVVVKGNGFEVNHLRKNPVYVSGFDNM
ncbi:MAG: hypothetical protein RIC35_14375 [Marinoscillum sp.]